MFVDEYDVDCGNDYRHMTVPMAVYDEVDDADGASREPSSKVKWQDDGDDDGGDGGGGDDEQGNGARTGGEEDDDPRGYPGYPCRVGIEHRGDYLCGGQKRKWRIHPTWNEQAKACVKNQRAFGGFDSALAKESLLLLRSHGWDQWVLALQLDNQVQGKIA